MKVVLLGTPQEACEVFSLILANQKKWGVELIGAVSQPARPAGRKKQLSDPPVAQMAREHGLKVLQPESARSEDFKRELVAWNPDVVVTAAYGQILDEQFLAIPNRATINIHPSLLPQYRGATPVQSALLDGAHRSGVTVQFTVKKLDAGNIIKQEAFDFGHTMTAGELLPRLFQHGARMLEESFEKLRDPDFKGVPQDETQVTFSRKFTKEDGLVLWHSWGAQSIINRYRALTPWPGLYTYHEGVRVKLLTISADLSADQAMLEAGQFEAYGEGDLRVGTMQGNVVVHRLMRAGGKASSGRAFLNGLKSDAKRSFSSQES